METSKIKKALTEGSNWLIIGFASLLYIAMGLMTVEDGSITLNDFSNYTWLDWAIWAVLTFLPALIALVVSTAFKKEGIKDGKIQIQPQIDAYEKVLSTDETKKVRSEREFLIKGAMIEGAKKFVSALIVSFIAGQLFFNFTLDGILKIVINLSMWAFYGSQAFGNSYRFAISELKEWYILETGKLQKALDTKNETIRKEKEEALKKQQEEMKAESEAASKDDKTEIAKLKQDLVKANETITSQKITIDALKGAKS